MVKKRFLTPGGEIKRDLTSEEVIKFASMGDTDCRKELYKQAKKDTTQEKLAAIENYLGLI